MKNILILVSSLLLILSASCKKHNTQTESKTIDSIVTLENNLVSMSINLYGGAYIDFHYKDQNINPFTWKLTIDQMPPNNKKGAIFQGHFLCLGRWGSPTDGEKEAGVPHNGQATNSMWTKERMSKENQLIMSNYGPRDGMNVIRTIKIDDNQPIIYVTEEIKNITTIGRLNNVVQHATIGEPFLDTTTIINTNAGKGFLQALSYPNPHKYEFTWPNGYSDSTKKALDLSSSKTKLSYVSTHLYTDKYGWITASTPNKELLLGYIWKTKEYPWANIWHEVVNNKLWAKGLEFGTTGIGKSYQELLAVDTRFHGINSFEFLDAGQTVTKSFACFLIKIPSNYLGVGKIEILKGKIILTENSNTNPRITELNFEGFDEE